MLRSGWMVHATGVGLCVAASMMFGCSGAVGEDAFDDDEDLAAWANSGSALGVWTRIHDPVALAAGEQSFADPSCPLVEDDGTLMIVSGGCVDNEAREWAGTMVLERTVDAGYRIEFDEYGHGDVGHEHELSTGFAEIEQLEPDFHLFEVEIDVDGYTRSEIKYQGSVAGGFDGPTTWNGIGRVKRGGSGSGLGDAQVATMDQYVDDSLCSGQSASGRTIVVVDEVEMVVEYDGAADCDDDAAARVTVDGDDRGLVRGITCAVGDGEGGGAAALGLWVLVAAARWRRRRS